MAIKRLTSLADAFRDTNTGNTILGLGGNDTIYGLGGNDTIDGGTGADTLRGGLGNDKLKGGTGNDKLYGDAGNDTLDGGAGVDRLFGGAGNDTYILGAANDIVNDTGGIDTIASTVTRSLATNAAVENLTLLGAASINGTGNALNNTITGNAGNNNIVGGIGGDVLNGGAGADVFVYNFVSDSPWDTTGATFQNFNVAINDTISGFQQGLDKIDLSLANHGIFDAGQPFYFSGNLLTKGGFWQPNQFVQSFQLAEVAFANFGADTYVYVNELHFQPNNQGGLWGNQDQTPDLLIKLTGVFTLTANDFIL